MLNAIKREANITYTENGAVTYRSTMSDCLDFFSTAGALRNAEEKEIVKRFLRAYGENPDMAMKILFFHPRCERGPGGAAGLSDDPSGDGQSASGIREEEHPVHRGIRKI